MNKNTIIVKNRAEYSLKCNEIIMEFLKKSNLEERHRFVSGSNGDSNIDILEWIASDFDTDKATILMLYWRMSPGYNKQFINRDEVVKEENWYLRQFDFFEDIEKRLLADFYKNQKIAYDPTNDMGNDWTDEISEYNLKKKIPDEMFFNWDFGDGNFIVMHQEDNFDRGAHLHTATSHPDFPDPTVRSDNHYNQHPGHIPEDEAGLSDVDTADRGCGGPR